MVKCHQKIVRLVSRPVHDPTEVEDVAQDAFIKAYRALLQLRGESTFYTWLYRITISTAKNYLATQGRRPESPSDIDTEEAETFANGELLRDINTPDSMLYTKQMTGTISRAMEAPLEELRTAITLREIEGLSYEEVAEAMKRPIGTVRPRIFRAREAIAERLRPPLGTIEGKRWQPADMTNRRLYTTANGETSGSLLSGR